MSEQARDSGLVRAVGTWGLAASTINIIVGAGIFAVPAELAASTGSYAPLAFVACAFAIGAVAICFAEGGSRIPTSGGAYGYIEAAFGPLTGFIAGMLLWVGDVLACGGVAAALAEIAASLVAPPWHTAVRSVVIFGAVSAIAWVNIGGVARGTRFVKAATVVKLVPLAVFIIVGAGAVQAANYQMTAPLGSAGVGRGMLLALFAFTGMEVSLGASGEVAQPARTIPRALALALLGVTLLYVAVQVVAQGLLGPALSQSPAPLADGMARVSPMLRGLMLFAAAFSMLAWLGSDLLGTPRMLFALARDGRMPRILGRVHPRTHAPQVAITVHAAVAISLAFSGTFAELAVLATLSSTGIYILGCAAAWTLARKRVALAGAPLNFPLLGVAALIGMSTMAIAIALAAREEIIGLATLVAASTIVFWLSTRAQRRPHRAS
jgi:amino acid transporter